MPTTIHLKKSIRAIVASPGYGTDISSARLPYGYAALIRHLPAAAFSPRTQDARSTPFRPRTPKASVSPAVLAILLLILLLPAGCDKKDGHKTSHPDKGMIILTTDWSGRDTNIDIPETYTVAIGEYTATVGGETNTLEHLFEPDTYPTYIYNTPEHVIISGTTVTLAADTDNRKSTETFVSASPGWLFTCATNVTIEKDTDHELTAAMQQQVRQLTLVIEPTGGTTDRIEGVEGYLSGAAATFDMDNGTHGTPSNVALTFTKITSGADAGKWSATVCLLGVAGAAQQLTAQIRFSGNSPQPVTLTSDLTAALATFNADKTKPLALGGTVAETPTGAGFTATITDWTPVHGGPVTAN